MKRYAIAAAGLAGLFALITAASAAPAQTQCWWTGFNYGCSVPVQPYARSYAPAFLYDYGYHYGPLAWWRFGYAPYW